MSIERKCENCFFKDFYGDEESWTCKHCKFNGIDNDYDTNCKYDYFKPNEKAIREDERNKALVEILEYQIELDFYRQKVKHQKDNRKLTRQDEREKIIAMLKEELEDLDLSDYDNSFMEENYAIKDFIEKMVNKIKSM